ncbi:hypothetical protein [Alicyclobacillus acidoterrestris]|uniref:Uncharacterized protein n=1 Tax=Alicyclobacillus acidoterrestris (strain ATCC 49025 / DSM 3922 / CIP 106132 / NCIMB 13137 / GD3B) TaxID=1356854 RepID=T0CIW4_ALIAG|nr:hypothetical protein [Alicyclobacillus acidoterrestris]EPZ52759.1 hypothetical protein N007_19655 [Alicyclobacillus acidoterrestris ATCC 49025]UNO49401.1 hypothetical protein K1I37_02260 [Alicyclobacillus acidoterrestris]
MELDTEVGCLFSMLTESLTLFAEQNVDFIDAYLACKSRDTDGKMVSFDRDFQRLNVALHVPEYTG